MAAGPAALVFGPESSGLNNAEVLRCPYLVHIPADEAYPALNLAQAVAICLYEVRKGWLRAPPAAAAGTEVATWGEQARLFTKLQAALTRIRYLRGVRGEALMLGTISDDVQHLQLALAKYGYGVPVTGKYDGPTMEVVTAFKRHFRPARVDGVADHSTLITLHALLTSLPDGRAVGK